MGDAERLHQVGLAMRAFLEPRWREWHATGGDEQPAIASANTCGRTSLLLVHALRHERLPAEWRTGVPRFAATGPEQGPFGFRAEKRWESHSWVQSGDWIIDITADQFGADPVIVTPADDPRYGIGPIDPADPIAKTHRQRIVEALWPHWLDHRFGASRGGIPMRAVPRGSGSVDDVSHSPHKIL